VVRLRLTPQGERELAWVLVWEEQQAAFRLSGWLGGAGGAGGSGLVGVTGGVNNRVIGDTGAGGA
jgi:hypothetical protein